MKAAKNSIMNPEHQEFLKRIGISIEELRKNNKVTITKLVDEVQMHRNAYRQLKDGNTYFKISALLKILDYFEINYYDFLKKIEAENKRVGARKPK